MKHLITTLRVLGFSFQYTIPFVLFGAVMPYRHGDLKAGLTGIGRFAIVVFCLICIKKIKEKVLTLKDSCTKATVLAIIECVPFVLIWYCLDWISRFTTSVFTYWGSIIPYFVVGTLFKLTAGIMKARGIDDNTDNV